MPFNWGAFLGGYAQGRERSLARQEREEERKLKERMYKDNLRLQEMTANRQQQIFDRQQQSYDREAQGREQISAAVGAGPGDMLGQRPQGVEGPTGPEGGFYSFSPERQQSEIRQGLAKAAPASDLNAVFAPGGSQNRAPFSVTDRTYFDARAQGATHEQALEMAAKARLALSTASAQAPFDVRANPQNQAIQQQYNFGTGAARGAGTVAGTVGQQLGEPIQPMQPMVGAVQPGPSPIPQTPRVAPGFQPGGNVFYDPQTLTPQEAQQGMRQIPLGPTPPAAVQGVQPSPLVTGQAGASPYMRGREQAAGATKTGTERAEMSLPLRERATSYINPTDLTTPPANMTEAEALAKGYRSFKGNSGQFITMARSAFNILDRLETLSKELLPESSGGKDPMGDATLAAQNWARLQGLRVTRDPKVKEFFALLDSNLAQFAKAAGDAANIAVPEQAFQKKALPGPGDTRESALQLIQSKKAILRGVLDGATGMKPIGPQAFPGASKPLPISKASEFLQQSGGDPARARQMAIEQGYDPKKVVQ